MFVISHTVTNSTHSNHYTCLLLLRARLIMDCCLIVTMGLFVLTLYHLGPSGTAEIQNLDATAGNNQPF